MDIARANADIRITSAMSKGYTITSALPLKGRGISGSGNGNFYVTHAALARLEATYTVRTDF